MSVLDIYLKQSEIENYENCKYGTEVLSKCNNK